MKFKDADQSAKHFAIIIRIDSRVNPKVIYGKDFEPMPNGWYCFAQFWLSYSDGRKHQEYLVEGTRGLETSFTLN